jgi:hypothetical protein
MTTVNRTLVGRFYELMGSDVAVSGDRMVVLGELLDGQVTEDFKCLMIGPAGAEHHPGLRGFARAWRDWVSPYTSFSIELEDVREVGDAVVVGVLQCAVTRHDGVPIETASGSIWRFRDGLLCRAEFYLDRGDAYQAVGLDQGS